VIPFSQISPFLLKIHYADFNVIEFYMILHIMLVFTCYTLSLISSFFLFSFPFIKIFSNIFQLDILVNNVGRSQRARWEHIDIAVDKEIFELNVFSILSLSRLVVKYFLQIGEGHIVVTSSVAGIAPVPMSPSYCGTKYALQVKSFFLIQS